MTLGENFYVPWYIYVLALLIAGLIYWYFDEYVRHGRK